MSEAPTPPTTGAQALADELKRLNDIYVSRYDSDQPCDIQYTELRNFLWSKRRELIEALRALAEMRGALEKAQAAVVDYNGNLRSAHSIALRAGDQTNWREFREQAAGTLDKHHETFVVAEAALARRAP